MLDLFLGTFFFSTMQPGGLAELHSILCGNDYRRADRTANPVVQLRLPLLFNLNVTFLNVTLSTYWIRGSVKNNPAGHTEHSLSLTSVRLQYGYCTDDVSLYAEPSA